MTVWNQIILSKWSKSILYFVYFEVKMVVCQAAAITLWSHHTNCEHEADRGNKSVQKIISSSSYKRLFSKRTKSRKPWRQQQCLNSKTNIFSPKTNLDTISKYFHFILNYNICQLCKQKCLTQTSYLIVTYNWIFLSKKKKKTYLNHFRQQKAIAGADLYKGYGL